MSTLNVCTVASETVWKDKQGNIEKTEHHVAEALRLFPKTQVILFPEVSLAGYAADAGSKKELAEPMNGFCVMEVQRIAKKYGVALICGMIEEKKDDIPYNTEFVVDKQGSFLASYRKNHLFTGSKEPDHYSAGDELTIFDVENWKCGLSICFDIRFPRLFEAYKKVGVECIFSGFDWVPGRNKAAAMDFTIKTRANENQYFVVAVDRSASDVNASFHGKSIIANPYGEDISTKQGVYSYAELDKNDIKDITESLPLSGSFREKYAIK